ncbi:ATP-binding protein [Fulvivirga ulvae]|uniref:ATP-binding protein n=1 Tax=Fulvivirga ulvae TaxID=2904245 RepID=UPI001F45DF02|nr:ATP-binding protein [Fulvivirga ulvae]UII33178.1 ATP-binding protein [Fulvivirga ulvae]
MKFVDVPIGKKLLRAIILTSGVVLLITCSSYFAYEFFTFRQSAINQLSIIGEIVADNSTAALAFNSQSDATEVLASLKAHPHIEAAGIYDNNGKLFAHYPEELEGDNFPDSVNFSGYALMDSYIIGVQHIAQKDNRLGTLYLKSNTTAIARRLQLYAWIAVIVSAISFLVAYILSQKMQRAITGPVRELADTALAISERKDYTVRATKFGSDEVGALTTAFNQMLDEIQAQNKAIKSFNAHLEEKIKERTAELEIANKELESFTSSVSHDLRAPLRSVIGYSKIIEEDYSVKLGDEGVRMLNLIISNGQRMGQLIDDLLAFSKVGKQDVLKVPLDMEKITSEVIDEMTQDIANTKSVEIKTDKILDAEGDKSMIKQVMTNLISNALKYSMKEAKPCIEIGSYQKDNTNVYYVKDNGVGFDMQYYDKLFGVFERLHNQHDFEGTGVGLALVHRIVLKHDGQVWAEGKVNEGATFYFSLPGISDMYYLKPEKYD